MYFSCNWFALAEILLANGDELNLKWLITVILPLFSARHHVRGREIEREI